MIIMAVDITNIYYTIPALFLLFTFPVDGAAPFTFSATEATFDGDASCTKAVIHSEDEMNAVWTAMQTDGVESAYIGLRHKSEGFFWRDHTPFVYSNFEYGDGSHHVIVCANNSTTIKCNGTDQIRVLYAHYGRTSTKVCSTNPYDQPASGSCPNPETFDTLKTTCGGKLSCLLEAKDATFSGQVGSCANSDQQYVEMVYECLPAALQTESCVYMDGTSGRWFQTECSTQKKSVCEAPQDPTDSLNCTDVSGSDSSTQKCPAERPVAVGCVCTCNIYAIDAENGLCQCMCPTNTSIKATCCARLPDSPYNPGFDTNPTLECSYTDPGNATSTCATGHKALGCAATISAKAITSCTSTTSAASWCCRTTFSPASVALTYEASSTLVASHNTDIASISTIDDCYKKCTEDSRCLAVVHASGTCSKYYKIEKVEVGATANLMRRKYPYYSSNMLSDYHPFVTSLNLHVRRLDGIAIGNITYDTCLESCTEEDTCYQLDWRNDGVCYASYANTAENNCKLLTNAPFRTTNSFTIKDALRYGIILNCYWTQSVTDAACNTGYALTSCSCSTTGLKPTSTANSCTCDTGTSTNSSAAIQCCKYTKTAPRVCPPGQELNMTTATCKPCLPGLVSTGFGSLCKMCPPGLVSNSNGSTECTKCEKDWIPNTERMICEKCPMGHFTNGTGSSTCFPVDCGAPPNVSNANVTINTTTFSSVASYSCLPGFRMANATSFMICGCYGNWTGQNFTCEDINECESNPCINGTCNNMVNQYNCTCLPGFTGFNCESDIDECASAPCDNDGTCVDQVNGYQCQCLPGYTGTNCETNIDECNSGPCLNSGTCLDKVNGYECTCATGFTGINCETDIDECSVLPCQNGGTCSQGVPGTHSCACAIGFTGSNCETDIDECHSSPCKNSGTCVDKVNDFQCNCPLPYTGKICDIEFQPSGCKQNGTAADQLLTGAIQTVKHSKMTRLKCVNYCNIYALKYSATTGGDTCTCGSILNPNAVNKTDCLTTCSGDSGNSEKCGAAAGPTASANLYTSVVQSKSAYADALGCFTTTTLGSNDVEMIFPHSNLTFDNCLKACGAIDFKYLSISLSKCYCLEAKPTSTPLLDTACTQACPDDPTKKCGGTTNVNANVYGATVLASDADPCISNPCQFNGTCSNHTLPSGAPFYNCSCVPGYKGVNCETDINECEGVTCQNGGTCLDLVNMFNCSCPLGYAGVHCEIVHNCSTPTILTDGSRTFPKMTYGEIATYTCNDGFYLGNSSDGKATCNVTGWVYPLLNCYSIDDCQNVTCQNNAACIDGHKNYTCKCDCPYYGRHCELVVDCGAAPNITFGFHNYTGNSSNGAMVTYKCNDGYKMVNGTGLKMCSCLNKWVGDNVGCVEIDECLSNPCQNGGTCHDLINMYNCTCPVGTNGTNCEINMDDCIGVDCGPGTCLDAVNNYTCKCPVLFTGSKCQTSVVLPGPINVTDVGGVLTVNPRSSVECEQAPLFPKTVLVNDGVVAGTTLVYSCTEKGMAFTDTTGPDPTKRSIYCNGQGRWLPEPQGCQFIQCPIIPLPWGTMRDTEDRVFGLPVTYQCTPGLSWSDGSRMRSAICEATGQWSSTVPPCSRRKCPNIRDQTNAYVSYFDGGDVSRPARVMLRCGTYQVFSNGAPERNATCTPDGKWIPSDLKCDFRCIPPPWIENAPSGTVMTTTDQSADVFVSCQLGYRYPDGLTTKKLKCNADLTWDLSPPACEEKVCEKVPEVGGATPSSKLALVGHNVTYSCSKYYWFNSLRNPNATIYCFIANVSWSQQPENCSEIHCGAKEVVVNANYDNSIADTPEKEVTYTCQGTKKFVGGVTTKKAVCTFKGVWTPVADSCEDNRCSAPYVPQYSIKIFINATKGAKLNFTCAEGYQYSDNTVTKIFTCLSNLQWDATVPDCKPIICPVLHNISSIKVSTNNHTFMAKVNVSCARGNKFSDGSKNEYKEVTCTSASTWTTDITASTCELIKCEKPRVAQYCWPNYVKNSVWDSVTYYCKTGFQFAIGKWFKDISCQENGTWTDETVKEGCTVVECPFHTWYYGTWNTSSFVVFTTINYTCPVNQTFKDRSALKITTCLINSKWSPSLEPCYDLNSEVFKVEPTDAKGADTIGIVSAIFVSVVFGLIALLDIGPQCAKLAMKLK